MAFKRTDEVVEALRKKVSDDTEVIARVVTKENDEKYTSLTLKRGGERAVPAVRLEYLEDADTRTADDLADEVIETIRKYRVANEQGLVKQAEEIFKDRDTLLRSVRPQLINKERSAEFLKTAVSRDFLDLSVIYKLYLDDAPFENGYSSILVVKEFLRYMDITEDELYKEAVKNLGDEISIRNMAEILPFTPNQDMLVISNKTYLNGAGVMLCRDMLNNLSERYDSDIIIIPASRHEILAIPDSEVTDMEYLKYTIRFINSEYIEKDDFLSDNAYIYSRKKGSYAIAG